MIEADEKIIVEPHGDWHMGGDTDSKWYEKIEGDVFKDLEAMKKLIEEAPQPTSIPIIRFRASSILLNQIANPCWDCTRGNCPPTVRNNAKEKKFCAGYFKEKPPIKVKVKCVICTDDLDAPENFPPNFPNIWKACCYCVETWCKINRIESILEDEILSDDEVDEIWSKYEKKFKEIFGLCQ